MQREKEGNYDKPKKLKNFMSIKTLLIFINFIFISVGQISGVLLVRIYYLHGGKKKVVASIFANSRIPNLDSTNFNFLSEKKKKNYQY